LAVQKLATDLKRTALVTGASSTVLTGTACSPYGSHWLEDSYALTTSVVRAAAQNGGKTWFFVTLDNAFGAAMLKDGSDVVNQVGGKVVGVVRHPLGQADLSSFLVQAAASNADYIALANVGSDTTNAVKQAQEFGIGEGKQHLVAFTFFVTDIRAVGLKVAQNLILPSGFYWDESDASRAFSRRFLEKFGRMPTNAQAVSYAATLHYLKAVQAAGTDEADAVNRKMRELPVDYFGKTGSVRADGRVIYDMTMYRVKTPAESKYDWDYLASIGIVPGTNAFRPLSESQCPMVTK
jgi:branched-chain amino acid transport system substrate-binding protein